MLQSRAMRGVCVCVCEVLGEGYLRPVMLFKVGEYESCVL